jgi:hypothetical protein
VLCGIGLLPFSANARGKILAKKYCRLQGKRPLGHQPPFPAREVTPVTLPQDGRGFQQVGKRGASLSFDHLVGAREDGFWVGGNQKRARSFIDETCKRNLDLSRLRYRQPQSN